MNLRNLGLNLGFILNSYLALGALLKSQIYVRKYIIYYLIGLLRVLMRLCIYSLWLIMALLTVFQCYNGVKVVHIQLKLYFEFWISIFPWAGHVWFDIHPRGAGQWQQAAASSATWSWGKTAGTLVYLLCCQCFLDFVFWTHLR